MKILQDRVAAVTGAASGIGRALAVNLAHKGCNLALSDVNEAELTKTKDSLSDCNIKVSTHVVNVGSREDVYRYADEVVAEHGRVDLIINNAGVTVNTRLEDATYEDMEWLMGINLWGVIYGTKAFLPHLKNQAEGHIVNIASINSIVPIPWNGPYNASKYAVMGFTETLAQELAGTSVRVTCVHPGGVKTNIVRNCRMDENQKYNSSKFAKEFDDFAKTTPEQAASIIIKGIQKNDLKVFVGMDAKMLNLCRRMFPGLTIKMLGKIATHQRNKAGLS